MAASRDYEKNYNLSLEEVKRVARRKNVHLVSADNKGSLKNIFNKGLDTGRDQYVMIHYQTGDDENSRYGHWVGMIIKPKEKMIYYMDSYGIYPDDELEYIPKEYRRETGQSRRDVGVFLYRAINEFGYRVRYNDVRLQGKGKGIGTCGRYVGMFLFYGATPEEFAIGIKKMMKDMKVRSADDVVVDLTREIIQ